MATVTPAGMELNAVEVVNEIIKQDGFPIVVALWFMFRTDKRLDKIALLLEGKKK